LYCTGHLTQQQRNEPQQQQQQQQSPHLPQQQQIVVYEPKDTAVSCDGSNNSIVSSDAPHTDVAADVTEWNLQVSTWILLNKKLLSTLRPAGSSKLEDVSHVLAELQRYAVHADDEHDSTRAQRLKLSLQNVVASKRARDTDKRVLSKWIKQQRQHATVARGHLNLVTYHR
jgi:hypothetical protein